MAANLSKQEALDADSRAIEQIIYTGKTDKKIRVYFIIEQSKKQYYNFWKEQQKFFN